jgi:serine phosphatase RsbU (regulator of sigma subunit)/CheY-like chemotaxis protein
MPADTDNDYIIEDIQDLTVAAPQLAHWFVLVVDDDEGVHSITRVVLADVRYQGRPIRILSAYSASEAERLLRAHPDIAVVLVDVVMESDDAGLRLVRVIRETMGNRKLRIILRTGQPGQAPERDVILGYDINDYKSKTELTSQKLFTATISALRSYSDIVTLDQTRRGLERIIATSTALSLQGDATRFASLAVARFPDIIGIPGTAALCVLPSVLGSHIRTLAVEGPLTPDAADPEAWLPADLLGQGIADGGWRALDAPRVLVRPMDIPDHGVGALLLLAEEDIPADRRHLADIYAASLGVWLRNVSLQDSLRRHQSTLEQQVADRTAELTRVNAGLQAAHDRINADLEVARVLQQSILPASFPTVPGSLGHAVMRAAQQIGGDFFDVFDLGASRIGVVVGDVCGKGVAAALFMGIARTILRNLALEGLSPGTCLARANSLIFEQNPLGMYLTAVYGILDTAIGQFSYAVGGHDPPILCTRDGIALAPRAGGMLLGLLDREAFTENTVQLAVGDTVILFTDGVTECFNPDGIVLGEARLLALAAILADRSPAQMVEGVVAAVDAHAAGQQQSDDITCLALRYAP